MFLWSVNEKHSKQPPKIPPKMRWHSAQHVLLPLLLTVTVCSSPVNSASDYDQPLTESAWRRLWDSEGGVWTAGSGYLASVGGRSKVECIRECTKYTRCNAFVFNATTGTCYLQPSFGSEAGPAALRLGHVYIDKNADCTPYKAPASNGSVSWSQTETSLQGTVTCGDDFINTTAAVTMQCVANGSWQIDGRCAQHVWTNPPAPEPVLTPYQFSIPMSVVNGWTVCVEGIPLLHTRFTVDLIISPLNTGNISLHTNVRIKDDGDVLVLNHKVDGTFGNEMVYPLTAPIGQLFKLNITHREDQYEVYVNGVFMAPFTDNPVVPFSMVSAVQVHNAQSFNLIRLDNWCFE